MKVHQIITNFDGPWMDGYGNDYFREYQMGMRVHFIYFHETYGWQFGSYSLNNDDYFGGAEQE